MLQFLSDILNTILCWIIAIANMVLWALMTMLNLVISALAFVIGSVVGLLPVMPTLPDWSGVTSSVFGTANWFFPVGYLVLTLGTMAVLYFGWLILKSVFHYGGFTE